MQFRPRSPQHLGPPVLRVVGSAADATPPGTRGQDPAEDAFVDICTILARLTPADRARVLDAMGEW